MAETIHLEQREAEGHNRVHADLAIVDCVKGGKRTCRDVQEEPYG